MRTVIKMLTYVAESILPLFFWVFIIFGFDAPDIAVITILSALMHEIGHILGIALTGRGKAAIRGHVSGFRISSVGGDYKSEIVTLAAGPLMNVFVFLVFAPLSPLNEYLKVFGYINLITALSNLLPVEGYDGYGIFYKIFSMLSFTRGIRLLQHLSFFFSAVFTFISLYMILKIGEGYWIFGVFFSMLISKIIKLNRSDVLRE